MWPLRLPSGVRPISFCSVALDVISLSNRVGVVMKQYSIIPFFFTKRYVRLLGVLASLFSLGLHVQAEDLCGRAQLCVYSDLARIFSFDEANPQRELANTVLFCTGDSSLALEWTEEHFPSYHSAYGLDSTPLHRAIREGDGDLALKYITEGLFTNVRESSSRGGTASEGQGYTPLGLLMAGKNSRFGSFGRNKLVNALLVAGADPNALMSLDGDRLSFSEEVPLYYAVRVLEDRELARMLLDAGADPESPALEGKGTPLHWLAIAGDKRSKERIRELVCAGADVDAGYCDDGCGDTPLHWAIEFHSGYGLIGLIMAGADLDLPRTKSGTRCSPLRSAFDCYEWVWGGAVLALSGANSLPSESSTVSFSGYLMDVCFEVLMSILKVKGLGYPRDEVLPEWFFDEDYKNYVNTRSIDS